MASAVDSRLAYARLSAVAMASRLPTANRGSTNSYTTSWDTTDIKGAMWWLERRFPEQFGRRDQMDHTGKVAVHKTQTQERKLTIELVNADGEVHRLTRDDAMNNAAVEPVEPKPEPEP